jgi:N-methylhydantoinase A/oxoprolinase/acetone carboxylase beta subunit
LLQFDFAEKYERMYGAGSSPTGAVVEIVMVRVDATAARRFPVKFPSTDMTNLTPESDPTGARAVWWRGRGWTPTAVYQFEAMNIGQKITGPAIIDSYGTSIPVAPDQSAEIDKWRNVSISFPQ